MLKPSCHITWFISLLSFLVPSLQPPNTCTSSIIIHIHPQLHPNISSLPLVGILLSSMRIVFQTSQSFLLAQTKKLCVSYSTHQHILPFTPLDSRITLLHSHKLLILSQFTEGVSFLPTKSETLLLYIYSACTFITLSLPTSIITIEDHLDCDLECRAKQQHYHLFNRQQTSSLTYSHPEIKGSFPGFQSNESRINEVSE